MIDQHQSAPLTSHAAPHGTEAVSRLPIDVVALAIHALSGLSLSPDQRLREVARLAIAMHAHEESYRAAAVDEGEIEAGCRVMGELTARTLGMNIVRAI